jgi:hypothetical protein
MDAQATFSYAFTQSDIRPLAEPPSLPHWAAQRLLPQERRNLAIQVLAGAQPISDLAREYEVSRKFLYQQAHTAEEALSEAFAPSDRSDDVLFYLPVTKTWLRQLVLALVLICHSSVRGVVELLRDVFDYRLSVGTVHNIVHSAVTPAQAINRQYDLSSIRVGLLDEIFQANDPVFVGVDAQSTFCFLLSPEQHCDADTWGIRLLELVDQGFAPEANVADFGAGLRAGHKEALPGVPCRGDIFHALYTMGPLVSYLEKRAYQAIDARTKLERKRPIPGRRCRRKKIDGLPRKLRYARSAEAKAIALAEEVALLMHWLQYDILSVAGPEWAVRRDLFDFVVAELRARESACPHQIKPARTMLENQRDNLLAFTMQLDRDLENLAQDWQIGTATAREALEVERLPTWDPKRWTRMATLRETLRGRYHGVWTDVRELADRVVRASSLVENLNSRLRSYFFLRRQLGKDYLTLLQFFLNHRRYLRSEDPSRVDKSPAGLLTGQRHAHWLELLGYTRFTRN